MARTASRSRTPAHRSRRSRQRDVSADCEWVIDVQGPTTAVGCEAGLGYPPQAPYSPSERYPEYPFDHMGRKDNPLYRLVRQVFIDAGLDRAHIGRPSWNPLGRYVRRGSRVFVLCNFVYHRRPRETLADFQAKCVHGSVVRALIDYVCIATGPRGVVQFGNAPLQSCRWPKVLADAGADGLGRFYADQDRSVDPCDLRLFTSEFGRHHHRDPADAVVFDLGDESRLAGMDGGQAPHGRPRVHDYDPDRTEAFHCGGSHRYAINRAVLEADTVISLPKLKTHEKVGITCALKGLVGAVAHKDCLAHHRFGSPRRGGDEFPDRVAAVTPLAHLHDWLNRRPPEAPWQRSLVFAQTLATGVLRRLGVTLGGAWHGNDTAWRMVHDLVRILLFGDCHGALQGEKQRNHVALVDGVVAGEGDGPLAPSPVNAGAIMFSDDLSTADRVAWRLMGYDPAALKLLDPLAGLAAAEDGGDVRVNGGSILERDVEPILGRPFKPPRGWRSHLANWTLA